MHFAFVFDVNILKFRLAKDKSSGQLLLGVKWSGQLPRVRKVVGVSLFWFSLIDAAHKRKFALNSVMLGQVHEHCNLAGCPWCKCYLWHLPLAASNYKNVSNLSMTDYLIAVELRFHSISDEFRKPKSMNIELKMKVTGLW